MALRLSRRHAAIRGLALLAGLALAASDRSHLALAQPVDPPDDAPWPEPPLTQADEPESTAHQVDGEGEPADLPAPDSGAAERWGVPPVQLMIPTLGVEAAVEAVNQDPDGAMSAPTHPDEIAWYEPGPGMGVPGNVIFAAHVNWGGLLRPFGQLHLLEPGDVIQVIDAQGRGFEYAVDSSWWVRAEGAPLDEIFAQPPEPVITLITCGGEYVAETREYLDRLIVTARGA